MQIKKIAIEKLSNDPANARKHNDRNIEAIVGSLRRFGQQKPIVVDVSGVVRAGNGTLEAARRLGWKDIDCVETQLKGSDAIAYAIADNRTAELADWDDDVLAAQLNGLLADEFDRPSRSEDHPTMKPVALFAYQIGNSTAPQADQLGRTCYGMELSPQYCDVIVKRWENLTGEKAVCQSATPA